VVSVAAFTDSLFTILHNSHRSAAAGRVAGCLLLKDQRRPADSLPLETLIRADFGGKGRLLLTGILDLVIQQNHPLTYPRSWRWVDKQKLSGAPTHTPVAASAGDVEIWDYKGTKADTNYITDYVRQLLTYAALYKEKSGELPKRCVLFFVNEKKRDEQLLAIEVDEAIVASALKWTIEQVKLIRATTLEFQRAPLSVEGGGLEDTHLPIGQRVTDVSDFDQRAADISVDHPRVVENYRSAHEIALRVGKSEATTEDLRTAMIYYRSLFEELVQVPTIVERKEVA
jgi:hypothetical protein